MTATQTVSTETSIKREMLAAQRLMWNDHGYFVPPRGKRHTYADCGVTITLIGPGPFNGPLVNYDGPLGSWQSVINPKGIGKPH